MAVADTQTSITPTFSGAARRNLDRLVETRPSVEVAPLLVKAVASLLDHADSWHEGYTMAAGGDVEAYARADGMDDAAVEIVDTIQDLLEA